MSEDPELADGHHLARGAAANLLVLIASNFRAVFTFLIARILGPAAFGRFGVAFATTNLLSKVGQLGLDSSIVPLIARRAAAGDVEACRRLFRQAIALAAVVSVIFAVAGLAAVNWVSRVGRNEALRGFIAAFSDGGELMLLALPGIAIARISSGVSRGLLDMRNELYSRGLTETWATIGMFLLALAFGIRGRAPALAVVVGTTSAAAVAFALAARALGRLTPATAHSPITASPNDLTPSPRHTITPSHDRPVTTSPGSLLRYSLPTAGSSLLIVLVTEVDVLLLASFVGRAPGVTLETLGVFVVAAHIAVGLRKVRQVFDPIFAPVVARRRASDQAARLRQTVAGPSRWVLSTQLPLVGVLVLSGGAILSIYGADYRQGALWLALLALAHGANTFAGLVETLLMIERPALNLINAAVTVAVQIAVGLLLIPRFGATGAALAMCVGFSVQGILRFAELRHVYGWSWPWGSLAKPILAFTLAFVPAATMRLVDGLRMEIVSGGTFLLLYAAAWRLLGADPVDKAIWQTLIASRKGRS